MIDGQCFCDEPFFGRDCQISSLTEGGTSNETCRPHKSTEMCSNRGICVGGECVCYKRINLLEVRNQKLN